MSRRRRSPNWVEGTVATRLVLYDPESRQLRAHALDFPKGKDIFEEGVVFPMEGTPSGLAFTSRQTVIVRNLELERFASTPLVKILRAEGVKSGCSVPLIAHGEAVGVLTLMGFREEAFSESDAELLTQIGGQIALAVENALSFDRARQAERRAARERDRIKLLLDINNAIVSHLELGAASKRENAFSDKDKELLVQVANQVAIAVDNALNFERARKAEQEARRHFDRLSLVLRINNAVVSQLDLHELLQVISGSLREMVRNDTTGVALYEAESDKLRLVMTDFPEQMELVEESYLVPLEGSVMGLAFTSGEPVFLDEYDLERFPSDFTKRSYDAGLRSCGNIPLIAHGRKLGALGVASKRLNAFSAEDVELLCQIASQIAIAVENALNFNRARAAEQEAKRQSERSRLLLNLNNAIASALDLPALFRAVSASLRQVFQHDFAAMGLHDEQKRELRAYALDGADGLSFLEEGMILPLDGTPAGLAVTTRQVVIIGSGDAQKFSSEIVRRSIEQGVRSSC